MKITNLHLEIDPQTGEALLPETAAKADRKNNRKIDKKRRSAKRKHDEAIAKLARACTPRACDVSLNSSSKDQALPTQGGDTFSGSYIWMGAPNTTASAHYDRSHNFFAQITGHKRFFIWAPTQLPNLYISPFYHARDRQSQLVDAEWDEGGSLREMAEKFPQAVDSARGAPRFVADLAPGDLLSSTLLGHRVTSSVLDFQSAECGHLGRNKE